MLNNIRQFLPSLKLGIPLAGLLLTLGFVAKQTQPVLSSQIEKASTLLVTDFQISSARIQKSSEIPLLSRLREVREQRSQQKTASRVRKSSEKFEQRKLAKSTPVRSKVSIRSQQRSKYVTSANLSTRKTVPTTIALGRQVSVNEAGILPRTNFPVGNGIYLYGQSPKPNQLGQGYIIFQKQQGRVRGALYMPQSEFSCFQGTLDRSGELAMTVNGSPDEASSSRVAATNRLPRVTEDESTTYAYSVALQDYHQLNRISASDRRILQMCNQSSTGSYGKFAK
ncbi:hypothetical protein [aff. Roholtiella sp. LEGE 12411]|uniref:hypothetical protein n=1 Tax=aff. Roholtiella sp. LEGE 12411 TaxID=1828822 RepID=UPI001881DAF1|nr:hypothetical protein [aff. Roholtiella sp. LEGE 12411]